MTTSPHYDWRLIMTLNSWLSYSLARISEHFHCLRRRLFLVRVNSALWVQRSRLLRHSLLLGCRIEVFSSKVDTLIVNALDFSFTSRTCAVYHWIFRVRDCIVDKPCRHQTASHSASVYGQRRGAGRDNTWDRSCGIRGVWSNSSADGGMRSREACGTGGFIDSVFCWGDWSINNKFLLLWSFFFQVLLLSN